MKTCSECGYPKTRYTEGRARNKDPKEPTPPGSQKHLCKKHTPNLRPQTQTWDPKDKVWLKEAA